VSQYVPVELNKENELNFNPEVTSPIFRLVASFPKNNEEICFTCYIYNDTQASGTYI